jgi:F0F1-type ATP synthase delta subunit
MVKLNDKLNKFNKFHKFMRKLNNKLNHNRVFEPIINQSITNGFIIVIGDSVV